MKINQQVILVIDSLRGGGAQRVCVNLANGLSKSGWSVDLLVLNLKDNNFIESLSETVNLIQLNKNHVRTSILSLLKLIYQKKPKLFLVFNYEFSVLLIFLRFFFKFKYKIISRNISNLSKKKEELNEAGFWSKNIVNRFIGHFYHKADHIVNQCCSMQDDFIKINPKLRKNTSVIFNPLSNKIINYAENHDLSKIKKNDYLLCVGSLKKAKAFNYAIEGFARIAKHFPKLRLKIVGEGKLEKQLKKIAMDLGIESRVDFEGFQKDIIPFYLYARATVLTSVYEGFPNVLIESILLGTPVVSFDCPSGPSEIIEKGVNGFLVEYQNIEDLKNQLYSVLLTKFYIKKMNKTVKKYYPKQIIQKYDRLLKSFQ